MGLPERETRLWLSSNGVEARRFTLLTLFARFEGLRGKASLDVDREGLRVGTLMDWFGSRSLGARGFLAAAFLVVFFR